MFVRLRQTWLTWLTTVFCMVAASVPTSGLVLCLHGDHIHVWGSGTSSHDHDHDHPPAEGHREIEIDAFDGFGPDETRFDTEKSPVSVIAPSRLPQTNPDVPPPDAIARGPTGPPHGDPPGLRLVRSVVLLI